MIFSQLLNCKGIFFVLTLQYILPKFNVKNSLLVSSISPFTWDRAPRSILESNYFPYELCVLDSKFYNYSENIHQQSHCLKLVNDLMKSFHSRCWLGSRQQTADYGICVNPDWGCMALANRTGFWKYWSSLPTSTFASIYGNAGYAYELLNTIHNLGFTTVAFAGDSMAIQLGQHLLCRILRANASSISYNTNRFFSMGPEGGTATINFTPYKKLISNLSINLLDKKQKEVSVAVYKMPNGIGTSTIKGKYGLNGINTKCSSKNTTCRQEYATEYIYSTTLRLIKTGKKWGNTLHLFLLPIINKLEWEYEPLARAVLDASIRLANINSAMIIIGPLNQHFAGSPRGLYTNNPYSKEGQPACLPLPYPISEHPDSTYFKAALYKLNKNWEQSIGWYDIESMSAPWHDMHPELKATGWAVDCTHFGYSPLMFDPFWMELNDYLKLNVNSTWLRRIRKASASLYV